jgi:Acyl-CoA carboxylase epsilon subunit
MTRPPAVPPTEPASPEAALPGAVPSETVPSETVPFEIVSGGATAEEIAALTAVLATIAAASRRNVVPVRGPTAMSIWAERSRLVRRPLAHAPGSWRASARPT